MHKKLKRKKGIILNMKKKLKFNPQEFSAVIVESIASACLAASGVSPEQAEFIGKGLGSVVKGITASDNSSGDTILASIEKATNTVLESNSFEIPDTCKELLQMNILSFENIIDFMCRSESTESLRNQIIQIYKEDPSCDIETFPVEEFVSSIIESFEKEVLNNHELASYACYCMLRNNKPSSVIHMANQQYINSFEEPLFLHKDKASSRVSLKNLFVLQKYEFLNCNYREVQEESDNLKNLQDVIGDYLNENTTPFLFIEGDAGSGKTTLIAWMNYHYSIGDEISEQLFGNRPLLTIRLRDLDKKDISDNSSLATAIRKYMNLSSLDELERLYPNAIMLLDGFDELCMIEGIGINHEMLLYDLHQKSLEGFKFIVTTRPKFISPGINIPSGFISLRHFDEEQREIWLNHYVSDEYCAQPIDETIYSYIQSIDDDTASCICDTPMTLYMLAAKKGAHEFLDNNWALYHHIFFEELNETEYNKMFPDPDRNYSHKISILRDVLYQVCEEIAYQMYQKENQSFYLMDCDLSAIVEKLSNQIEILKHANMKEIAKRCYALCCYWKADSDRGAVEFLHNNIRDFFLAEKIYREMNEIIQGRNGEVNYKKITYRLCSLFQYGALETKVAEFIFLRAKYKVEKNEVDFAQYEYQHKLITRIIVYLSRDAIIDSNVLAEKSFKNPVQRIQNIMACTIQLYRSTYEAYLKETEAIPWVSESPLQNNILISLFKPVFCQTPVTITYDYMITLGSRGFFSNMDLRFCDLRNISFQKSLIKLAKFSDAILCGCDFSHAILDGSDFSNADLHYASLEDASLIRCNMTGVDLRGTELPDGYMSVAQEEQVAHLKSLQITGLII